MLRLYFILMTRKLKIFDNVFKILKTFFKNP